MKFAYADPPYFGQGKKLYSDHPEAAVWDTIEGHSKLISSLCEEYPDGWALSASSPSLKLLLPLCPEDVRIAAWVKPFCAFKRGVRPCYAWEPLLFRGGRNSKPAVPPKGGKQVTPKDYLPEGEHYPDSSDDFIAESITLKKGLTGAKPEKFCRWVLDLLNVQPGDEVHDLFPGTGIMTRVIDSVVSPVA